jgi:integrase
MEAPMTRPTTRRRAKGAGSWTVDREGVFVLRVELPPGKDGSRRRKVVKLPKGTPRREVEGRLADLVAANRRGDVRAGRAPTVAELVADHLEVGRARWAPRYVESVTHVANSLLGSLGRMDASKVSPGDLTRHYRALGRDGASPDQIHRLHVILGGAWKLGRNQEESVTNDPTAAAIKPSVTRAPIVPPSPEAVQALSEAAEPGTLAAILVDLAASTGMRRGEMAALRWSDLRDGVLYVSRAASQTSSGPIVQRGTKTMAGTRAVKIDDDLMQHLMRWRSIQAQHVLRSRRSATGDLADRFILSTRVSGYGRQPIRPDALTAVFATVREAAEVQCRLHDLRHFHCTQLLAAGVSPADVAARVGHANAAVTLKIYAGVTTRGQDAAVAIGAAWRTGSGPRAEDERNSEHRKAERGK